MSATTEEQTMDHTLTAEEQAELAAWYAGTFEPEAEEDREPEPEADTEPTFDDFYGIDDYDRYAEDRALDRYERGLGW